MTAQSDIRVCAFDPANWQEVGAFLTAATGGLMDEAWVRDVLTSLISGPDAVRDLWRGACRIGVGVCIDTCDTEGNAAELSIMQLEPDDEVLAALIPWAAAKARGAGRSRLDVAMWPGSQFTCLDLVRHGMQLGHVMYRMRRPNDLPISAPADPLPTGWQFVEARDEHIAAYYAAVVGAFAKVPGAFVPRFAMFEERLRTNPLRPQLLLTPDQRRPVAGWVRVLVRDDGNGELQSVGRHPALRGRGLGQHLVWRGLTCLVAQGAGPIELEVAAVNRAGLALYESFGFSIIGEQHTYRLDI